MKKNIIVFVLCVVYAGNLLSQWSPFDVPVIRTHFDILINCKTKSADDDSYYINEQWQEGEFALVPDQVFEGYPIKYDVKNNVLEIKVDNEIKILELYKIREFSWKDISGTEHNFINLNTKAKNTKLYGVAQILLDGKAKLIKTYEYIPKPESDVKYGAYTVIDHNYIHEDLYLMEGDKVLHVNNNKKKFMKFFESYSSDIMSFVKSKKLKINNVTDLKEIIEYYNTLISTVFLS